MPRVILKCPYLKGGGRTMEHRRTYVKYIATRPGAEKIDDTKKLLPATHSQKKLITQLLRDFPDTKDLFEYEDFLAAGTRGNASELITVALEQNLHRIDQRQNYVDYIANRPRVERTGTHGLFTGAGVPVVLAQVADEVANHPGNVWTPIISLRREDAARLGYDNAANWRALLSSQAVEFAKNLKIQPDNFRWYAAYHDEGHHPHVHMVCYSADPREGFLTRDGIRGIKAGIAARIFRQELTEIYSRQTLYRDDLTAQARTVMEELIGQMQSGVLQNDNIERLIAHLARRLQFLSGKKQYGYLKAPLKSVVDEIVDELAKDSRVAEAYRLWCETRMEVLRTYQKNPPEPGPLSKQDELKRIRNIVIEEAVKIGSQVFTFEQAAQTDELFPDGLSEDGGSAPSDGDDAAGIPAPAGEDAPEDESPHVAWSERYRLAKEYLYGSEETPRDFEMAFRLFTEEAAEGSALAMHDLGRMYTDGLGREIDAGAAQDWYAKALAAFHAAEEEKPRSYTQYRIGKMYAAGLGTERDYSIAVGWFRASAASGYKYAQYSLAGLYHHGWGVERDHEAARSLYSRSAEQGFPYADFELGKMYRDGVGTQVDTAAAGRHFKSAYSGFRSLEEQSHDDRLQYRLGWMLEKGVGTDKDIPAAVRYFEKAAGVGNTNAQYRLAKIILADRSAPPEKIAEAIGWLEKSAAAGNSAAQYALGKLFLSGEDIPKDAAKAVYWLTASANQGNQFAQYALGMIYLKGGEVPQNIGLAVTLLEKAALQGNEYAQYQLGKLFLLGEDTAKDVEAAVHWLTASAEQGNQYAQYALGKLFLTGRDVSRDRDAAIRWFTLSAAQGNIYAQFFLEHMDEFKEPSLMLAASRLLYHLSQVFRENTPPLSGSGGSGVDRKQRRKQRARKIALGHARDDHEQTLSL